MPADAAPDSERRLLLSSDGLRLERGEATVVQDLSFHLGAGHTLLLEGGNRTGKTGFTRALRRDPSAGWSLVGTLRFAGKDVLGLRTTAYRHDFLRHLAFVDENAQASLFPGERVRQLFRIFGGSSAQSAQQLLADLGFAAPDIVLRRRFGELSKGSRCAIALAIALSRMPRILVLDHITEELDALSADRCLSRVRQAQEDDGLAVLALCHSRASHEALQPERVIELKASAPLPPPAAAEMAQLCTQSTTADAARSKAIVRVEHLTTLRSRDAGWLKKPETVFALQTINFDLWRGELLALVGASPSGKTTLALTLARLLEPSLGHVSMRSRGKRSGAPGQRAAGRRLTLCFEDAVSSLDPHHTVEEQLTEVLGLREPPVSDIALVKQVVRAVGLDSSVLARRRQHLSLGEVELVALARALLVVPRVLVLDDALGHVEPAHRQDLLELLARERARSQLSTLWITHQLESMNRIADRIGVMYAGTLIELGPSADVLTGTHHPYTRLLFAMRQRGSRRLQLVAEGGTPDQGQLPSGCPFHPRCPRAEPGRCDAEAPSLLPIAESGEHLVACWHPHV